MQGHTAEPGLIAHFLPSREVMERAASTNDASQPSAGASQPGPEDDRFPLVEATASTPPNTPSSSSSTRPSRRHRWPSSVSDIEIATWEEYQQSVQELKSEARLRRNQQKKAAKALALINEEISQEHEISLFLEELDEK